MYTMSSKYLLLMLRVVCMYKSVSLSTLQECAHYALKNTESKAWVFQ